MPRECNETLRLRQPGKLCSCPRAYRSEPTGNDATPTDMDLSHKVLGIVELAAWASQPRTGKAGMDTGRRSLQRPGVYLCLGTSANVRAVLVVLVIHRNGLRYNHDRAFGCPFKSGQSVGVPALKRTPDDGDDVYTFGGHRSPRLSLLASSAALADA